MSDTALLGRRPLLDIHGAAEYLSVTVGFMRARRADRTIPCIKLGGSVRFDPNDLDRYVDLNREQPHFGEASHGRP